MNHSRIRKKVTFLLFMLGIGILVSPPVESRADTLVAFVNVNVIPMDRERVIPNQTVIVRNGRPRIFADKHGAAPTLCLESALVRPWPEALIVRKSFPPRGRTSALSRQEWTLLRVYSSVLLF